MKQIFSIIRWKYVIPTLLFIAGVLVFFIIFFDPLLARTIEKYGSKLNGAKVDVAGLHTKILQGRLSIQKLQITDKEEPMKNSVQMGPMVFQIDLSELFVKHLIIPQATLEGLEFNTDRKVSGELRKPLIQSKKDEKPSAVSQLTEKYKDRFKLNFDGLKDQAKAKVTFDPKQLALTKQGDALKEKAETLPNQWKAKVEGLNVDTRLKKIEADLNEVKQTKVEGVDALTTLPAALQKLNHAKSDLNKIKTDVQSTKDSFSTELKSLKDEANALKSAKKKDMDDLMSRFNLDFADPGRLVESLVGPALLGRAKTGVHYFQLARQHMPSKKEEEAVPPKPRAKGEFIYFPTPAALPRFWLMKAGLSGVVQDIAGSGEITDLTTNPSRVGKPLVINLQGAQGPHQFLLDVIFDHVTDEKKDSIKLEGNNLQLKKLITNGLLGEALLNGVGNARMNLKAIGEDQVEGLVAFNMSGIKLDDAILLAQVGVQSTTNLSREDSIKAKFMTNIARAIEQMPVVGVEAKLTGTWDNLDMAIDSNLKTELARVIKNSIGDVVADQKKELEAQLDKLLADKKSEVESRLAEIQSKMNLQLNGLDSQVQEKIKESTGINLGTTKQGGSSLPNIKIPSLDKLFKK